MQKRDDKKWSQNENTYTLQGRYFHKCVSTAGLHSTCNQSYKYASTKCTVCAIKNASIADLYITIKIQIYRTSFVYSICNQICNYRRPLYHVQSKYKYKGTTVSCSICKYSLYISFYLVNKYCKLLWYLQPRYKYACTVGL